MFNAAQDVSIFGGTFISGEDAIGKLLQEKVARGVFHDSDERFPAPRCSPGTRDDILTTITDWINDPGKEERFMWLCGPAQVGKSAIAQMIAERCCDADILIASFFFSRNNANCCDKSYLIPTIAYQLIASIPEIRNRVWNVLRNDPLILSRSMEAQAKALIVRPLTEVALGDIPRVVILDGLDECQGSDIQASIINVLSIVVKELPMPLLFLITSRPEQHIARAFSTKNMKSLRKLLIIDHCDHSSRSRPISEISLEPALLEYFPQESSLNHHILDDSVHTSYSSDNYINRPSADIQVPMVPLATDSTWEHPLIPHFGPLANHPPTPIHSHAPPNIQASSLMQNGSPPHSVDDNSTLDLANQNGPNSRFDGWIGWPENRAPERCADITPEERIRGQLGEQSWGNPTHEEVDVSSANNLPSIANHPPILIHPHAASIPVHIQTSDLLQNGSPPYSVDHNSTLTPSLAFASQVIESTHLKINHFGSRFIPHTTSQIRSVLPILGNTLLLIGHDNGLSVLNMFPQEWTEGGESVPKGPDEAQCREIWRGDAVYQMTIGPQGVVLALVGPGQELLTTSRDPEMRAVRIYNLSSLISLARWTVAQKSTTKPLDLYKISSWHSPLKKHRSQGSISRGLKSLLDSPPNHPPPEPSSSHHTFLSLLWTTGPSVAKPPYPSESGSPPARQNPDKSGWDMVEHLRWATDFVLLDVPSSRLVGASVVGFATWSDESQKGEVGGQLLAIATKSNILLYETPKGERAYRFVKEFYTPIPPQTLTFIQQSVADEMQNPMEEESPRLFHLHRSDSENTLKGATPSASSAIPLSYGVHLSLFVVFDKKAGWIRLADSAVGEVELREDGSPQPPLYSRDTFSSTMSSASLRHRPRLSFSSRESVAKWILPVRCELPVPGQPGLTQPVYILTRGKRTHVVPCPLPIRTSASPPLHAVFWKSHPKFVSPRIILSDNDHRQPLLQLVAFGENGIEVQEMGVSFMSIKGKGRAFPDELVRREEDLGGDVGFLSLGGNWHGLGQVISSAASVFCADSDMDFADVVEHLKEEGIYGWCNRGPQDWRVFWVGGNSGLTVSGEEKVHSGGING